MNQLVNRQLIFNPSTNSQELNCNQTAIHFFHRISKLVAHVYKIRKSPEFTTATEFTKGIFRLLFVAPPEQEIIEQSRLKALQLRSQWR